MDGTCVPSIPPGSGATSLASSARWGEERLSPHRLTYDMCLEPLRLSPLFSSAGREKALAFFTGPPVVRGSQASPGQTPAALPSSPGQELHFSTKPIQAGGVGCCLRIPGFSDKPEVSRGRETPTPPRGKVPRPHLKPSALLLSFCLRWCCPARVPLLPLSGCRRHPYLLPLQKKARMQTPTPSLQRGGALPAAFPSHSSGTLCPAGSSASSHTHRFSYLTCNFELALLALQEGSSGVAKIALPDAPL